MAKVYIVMSVANWYDECNEEFNHRDDIIDVFESEEKAVKRIRERIIMDREYLDSVYTPNEFIVYPPIDDDFHPGHYIPSYELCDCTDSQRYIYLIYEVN